MFPERVFWSRPFFEEAADDWRESVAGLIIQFLPDTVAKGLGRWRCEAVAGHYAVNIARVLRSFVPYRNITYDDQPLASGALDDSTPEADHHRSTVVVDVVGEYRDADNMSLQLPILVPLGSGIATRGVGLDQVPYARVVRRPRIQFF